MILDSKLSCSLRELEDKEQLDNEDEPEDEEQNEEEEQETGPSLLVRNLRIKLQERYGSLSGSPLESPMSPCSELDGDDFVNLYGGNGGGNFVVERPEYGNLCNVKPSSDRFLFRRTVAVDGLGIG